MIKGKMVKLVFSMLLSLIMILGSEVSAFATSESNVDDLIGNLIGYYGMESRTDVLRTLDEINDDSQEDYELWNSIVDYWDWIEDDMIENSSVAPDGLPTYDSHAFIVLGYSLNNDGTMTDELIGRLEVALRSAEKYPNSYVLVTGGVKKNGWTEGDRMHDWLLEHGVSEERIIVENQAPDTAGNASNSFEILYNDYNNVKSVSIITSQYHLKRGSILYYTESLLKAKELGKEAIEFIGMGNAGWYRNDKTSEPLSLKAMSMYLIAGVRPASNLVISKLIDINISGEIEYFIGDELNINVTASYDINNYQREVTDSAIISGFDPNILGNQIVHVIYEENGVKIEDNIEVNVNEIPVVVDKSILSSLIEEMGSVTNNNYTEESWEVFLNILKTAREVKVNEKATQIEVDSVVEKLHNAYSELKEVIVNKNILNSFIEEMDSVTNNNYTGESWEGFLNFLNTAKSVNANEKATQIEVDEALNNLKTAFASLDFEEKDINKNETVDKSTESEISDRLDKTVKEDSNNNKILPNTGVVSQPWATVGISSIILGLGLIYIKRRNQVS
jgi:LPXTG-motif cell wall-anchored protein